MSQHMDALDYANRTRLGRATLKRKVKAGKISIREVLMENDDCLRNLTVYDFLMWQDRWGHARTKRLLVRAGLSETVTVGALTDRQRLLLLPYI